MQRCWMTILIGQIPRAIPAPKPPILYIHAIVASAIFQEGFSAAPVPIEESVNALFHLYLFFEILKAYQYTLQALKAFFADVKVRRQGSIHFHDRGPNILKSD